MVGTEPGKIQKVRKKLNLSRRIRKKAEDLGLGFDWRNWI